MYVHPGAQHNFTGDIGRFRHLHNLAKNQLFNGIGRNFTARQQLTDDHFSQINGGNAMKRGCLTGKRRTQSAHNGDAIALTGNQR
ncbi:hypothetical protein D3C81_1930370 [compost metagenome]